MPSIHLDLNTPIRETWPEEDATLPLPEGSSPDALLNDLQAQVRIIGKMKPSLSELAARYQQRKSRIDQFVEWYANKPLWGKVLAGGLVVSTSYTIGAFAGVAWLLTGLITALYAMAITIIEEHAELMKQRDTLFSDDIPKMEALLEASIESFRVLEDKLNAVFQSLNELSIQRAEGLSEFEASVDVMGGHNLRYASLIEALGETAAKLSSHQNGVALDKAELEGLCTGLQNRLLEAETLTSTLSGLVTAVEQELKTTVSSELLGPQGDEVEASSIREKTAAHFSEIDRALDMHCNSIRITNTRQSAPVNSVDEDFLAIDQAIRALQQDDSASKMRHQERNDENTGGIVLRLTSLF